MQGTDTTPAADLRHLNTYTHLPVKALNLQEQCHFLSKTAAAYLKLNSIANRSH